MGSIQVGNGSAAKSLHDLQMKKIENEDTAN
jgi:hypothetical protein